MKIGDAVQLKSGGPKMTIKRTDGPMGGNIVCQWFAGSKLQEGHFNADSIEPYKDKDKNA